jgi:hypothetical protein
MPRLPRLDQVREANSRFVRLHVLASVSPSGLTIDGDVDETLKSFCGTITLGGWRTFAVNPHTQFCDETYVQRRSTSPWTRWHTVSPAPTRQSLAAGLLSAGVTGTVSSLDPRSGTASVAGSLAGLTRAVPGSPKVNRPLRKAERFNYTTTAQVAVEDLAIRVITTAVTDLGGQESGMMRVVRSEPRGAVPSPTDHERRSAASVSLPAFAALMPALRPGG